MQHVLDVIKRWTERIETHPLHRWLIATDDGIAAEQKLWFSLYFTNFIMYFRELNLYHVAYRRWPSGERHCDAITQHADEDMTHSRLFLEDFRTLGWDDLLDWRPSEVFHWLFTHPVNEGLRYRTVSIAKLYVESEHPLLRFAVVEAIEACGNALFRHTTQLSERYRALTGTDLIYFGAHHLARETGHAVESEDHALFRDAQLSREQRSLAIARASRAFELIDEQNTEMLRLAKETITLGGFRALRSAPLCLEVVPESHAQTSGQLDPWPNVYQFNFWPKKPHASQRILIAAVWRALNTVRSSAMLNFFASNDDEEMLHRLRLSLMYFATDCVGTPTFYRHMVSYPAAHDARERAINRMAHRFGTRSRLLYVDWQSLALDDVGWSVSRTLEFIYLDRASESHRDLRAVITHYNDVTTAPLLRYWTLVALKTMTNAHADACADQARRAERRFGISLPYLSGRRVPLPRVDPDPEADAVAFEALPADDHSVQHVLTMIDELAAAAHKRNFEMLESARRGDYPEFVASGRGSVLQHGRFARRECVRDPSANSVEAP